MVELAPLPLLADLGGREHVNEGALALGREVTEAEDRLEGLLVRDPLEVDADRADHARGNQDVHPGLAAEELEDLTDVVLVDVDRDQARGVDGDRPCRRAGRDFGQGRRADRAGRAAGRVRVRGGWRRGLGRGGRSLAADPDQAVKDEGSEPALERAGRVGRRPRRLVEPDDPHRVRLGGASGKPASREQAVALRRRGVRLRRCRGRALRGRRGRNVLAAGRRVEPGAIREAEPQPEEPPADRSLPGSCLAVAHTHTYTHWAAPHASGTRPKSRPDRVRDPLTHDLGFGPFRHRPASR